MATDKELRELAKVMEESGLSATELVKQVRAIQTGTYSKVVNHEKYGLQIELHSTTHRPFSLSINKATTVRILAEDINDFVENPPSDNGGPKVINRGKRK